MGIILARDAFVGTDRRAVCPFICLSARSFVCLFGTGVNCDTLHVSTHLSLWLDSPMSGHPDIKARPPTLSRLFPSSPEMEVE